MLKSGKPNMLFYADDMVLWAETKTELTMKLNTVVDMMEKLGLQISIDKTEIQCNTNGGRRHMHRNRKRQENNKMCGINKSNKVPRIMVNSRYG